MALQSLLKLLGLSEKPVKPAPEPTLLDVIILADEQTTRAFMEVDRRKQLLERTQQEYLSQLEDARSQIQKALEREAERERIAAESRETQLRSVRGSYNAQIDALKRDIASLESDLAFEIEYLSKLHSSEKADAEGRIQQARREIDRIQAALEECVNQSASAESGV